jgi:hypothetical protein
MPTPAPTGRFSRPVWPVLAAVLFLIGCIAWRWDGTSGLTSLLRFGSQFAPQRIPAVAALPVRTYEGVGYDGQFYSQLAVDPDIRRPEVQAALDNPRYRARRLLLPAAVHILGAGRPRLTLQLFALSNVAAWLALGWLLWRRVGGLGWHGTGIWLASMLGMGALDSVRLSLTDLPAMLLVFLAVEATERGRRVPALAALTAAALTRDTTLLAAAAAGTGDLRRPATWADQLWRGAVVALPFALWSYWLLLSVPSGNTLGTGHFTWPGQAILTQAGTCLREIAAGNLDSRYTFGLLAAVSLTWQAVFLLRRLSLDPPPWVRVAVPFALFYFVIGDPVWKGYWAVARTCLPLTFAYNLLLPRDRRFWPYLLLGNLCVLHAVYRILPD